MNYNAYILFLIIGVLVLSLHAVWQAYRINALEHTVDDLTARLARIEEHHQ